MMRSPANQTLTDLQRTSIKAACENLSSFRISYENRFFHMNRDNTFASEETLLALSGVIHAFDRIKLQQIQNDPISKKMFREAFKAIVDMLSGLEARNMRIKNPDISDQISDTIVFGYSPTDNKSFEHYAENKSSSLLIKFRYLLPISDGSDAFTNGMIPDALSQQAVKPLMDQLKRMLSIAYPTARQQALNDTLPTNGHSRRELWPSMPLNIPRLASIEDDLDQPPTRRRRLL